MKSCNQFLLKARLFSSLLFVLAFILQGCQKDDNLQGADDARSNGLKVSIKVGYEPVYNGSDGTKVTIDETSDNFMLGWSGDEELTLATSTSTNTATFEFDKFDADGYAVFTGNLPSAGSASETNYIAVNSDAFLSSGSNIVGHINSVQDYDPVNGAKYALLVSVGNKTRTGEINQPIRFKTMNSFLKFSVKKGSAATGSSTKYNKMYLRGVVLEALGGEPLSGEFGISKSHDEYHSSYASVSNKSSKVTLNGMTASRPNGIELGSTTLDLFMSVAFGEYRDGFKVTFYVANEEGEEGTMTKTFFTSTGKTLERNKLYTTPELTLTPNDVIYNYELLTNVEDITEGVYYLGGYKGDRTFYHIWKGSISKSDLESSEYIYNSETKQLYNGTGAQNFYLIKNDAGNYILKTLDSKYLYVTNYSSNRSLALSEKESEAHQITFGTDTRGGFTMTISNGSSSSYIQINYAAENNNPLRNYKSATSGTYGVVLFKRVGGYGSSEVAPNDDNGNSDDPGNGSDDPDDQNPDNPSVESGYLELPYIPEQLGANNMIYTLRAEMNGVKNVRNYSALYNSTYYAQMWTAYPLHSSHMGSEKRPSWKYNPEVPNSWQTDLSSSYGGVYSRGHQIANSERNGVRAMQLQTFYYTNSTPQLQNGFNGTLWQYLEQAIQDAAKSYSDTLYVVTGPVYKAVGGSEVVNYITNKNDGKSIALPNYYYKVVLKVKRNSAGQVTSGTTVGFWFEHKDYGNNKDYQGHIKSCSEIEALTGFTFFCNLPSSVVTATKSNTSWSAFSTFK